MHCVLNHAIDIADDSHATGEVYNVTYLLRAIDGGRQLDTWWGRYLDRYECRDGRWAIVHRVLRARVDADRAARRRHADRGAAVPAGRGRPGAVGSGGCVE